MHYIVVLRSPYHFEGIYTSKHRFKFMACLYAKFLKKCGLIVLVKLKV